MPKTIPKKTQKEKLCAYVATNYSITCHFCGVEMTSELRFDILSAADFARYAVACGWREVGSIEYAVIAAACEQCAKAKDSDR
jgi:hypothetical protein